MTRAADDSSRAHPDHPVSRDETTALFSIFSNYKHILIAVSGGADSMALMALAREWAKSQERTAPKFSVATVDHGLRKEAADEAAHVARLAQSWRMPHATLNWRGAKPKSGLQEKARAARYELLGAHARAIGADAVAIAHHADDQAETILMRLASGSGLAGLAGMRTVTMRDGIPLLRPFLALPSARLRATLQARGVAFIDDPSNANPAFARVRMRKSYDVLAKEGLTRERLQTLANRMARADAALSDIADAAERRHRMPDGIGRIYAPGLFYEPAEILLRVLQSAIAAVGTGEEPMFFRLEHRISDLSTAFSQSKSAKLTLGGAILSLSAAGRLTIRPESPRRKV